MTQSLDAILQRDVAAIQASQQQQLQKLLPAQPKTLILFGAGWLGRETAQRLQKLGTTYQVFFCDNNPNIGDTLDGIPILKKEKAIAEYADSATFVITIFNSPEVQAQLVAAGCKQVVHYSSLYRAHPDAMMPLCSLAQPAPIFSDAENVRAAYDLFADEESRQEFMAILNWHTQEEYAPLPGLHRQSEIYYTPDLVSRRADERYVDCGAFDGDSIGYFMDKWKNGFERIAGFEPITDNYERLKKYRASLPEEMQKKVDLYPFALGSKKGTLRFSVDGNASSAVNGAQEITVECGVLDEILADFHPTFIKMDIEGAEPDALLGAANILKHDAPLLTICLYHDIRHLWQIPLQIHQANPDYKLYLRRYAQDCWETVCYAIPPGR